MLNWKVIVPSVASFAAVTYVLCVAYGLLAPARFHAAWLLEAMLPGFTWLTAVSFVLGLVETAIYGAAAGALYTALHNFFARRVASSTTATRRLDRAA